MLFDHAPREICSFSSIRLPYIPLADIRTGGYSVIYLATSCWLYLLSEAPVPVIRYLRTRYNAIDFMSIIVA